MHPVAAEILANIRLDIPTAIEILIIVLNFIKLYPFPSGHYDRQQDSAVPFLSE